MIQYLLHPHQQVRAARQVQERKNHAREAERQSSRKTSKTKKKRETSKKQKMSYDDDKKGSGT